MRIEEDRICNMCDRTASNTYQEKACCGFHRRYFLFRYVHHTRHCDNREEVRQSLKRARHVKEAAA